MGLRLLRSFIVLCLLVLMLEAWVALSTKAVVTLLITASAVSIYLRQRKNLEGFQSIAYVSAFAAIVVLHFDQFDVAQNAADASVTTNAEVDVHDFGEFTTTFNKLTGDLDVHVDGSIMRQELAKNRKLRQDDPELWRKKLRENTKMLQEQAALGN